MFSAKEHTPQSVKAVMYIPGLVNRGQPPQNSKESRCPVTPQARKATQNINSSEKELLGPSTYSQIITGQTAQLPQGNMQPNSSENDHQLLIFLQQKNTTFSNKTFNCIKLSNDNKRQLTI